jgi:undecaprenyl-diphosphatase
MALINIGEADYKIWQQRLATSKLFRYFWQFWSNYAFVLYIGLGVYLLDSPDLQAMIWLAAASFASARLVVTVLINMVYKKQRPYQKFQLNPIVSNFFSVKTNIPNSFPSRHTITFAAVASSVFVFDPVAGLILLAVTIMTGIGRVILGYHWPADILAGLILGSITGYLVNMIGQAVFFT